MHNGGKGYRHALGAVVALKKGFVGFIAVNGHTIPFTSWRDAVLPYTIKRYALLCSIVIIPQSDVKEKTFLIFC